MCISVMIGNKKEEDKVYEEVCDNTDGSWKCLIKLSLESPGFFTNIKVV